MQKGAKSSPKTDPLVWSLIAEAPPDPPAILLTPLAEESPAATDAVLTAWILFFLQGLTKQRSAKNEHDQASLTTPRFYLPSDTPHWQALSQQTAFALTDLMEIGRQTKEVEAHFEAMADARQHQQYPSTDPSL
jgi:hypothetical protein